MSDWWSSGGHFYRTFVMSQLSLWLLREILNNHKNNRDLDHHLPPNLYRDMTNSSSFAHASEVNTIKTSNLRRSIISYSAGFRRPALSAALIFKEEKKSSCVAKVYVSVIWSGNRLNCTCQNQIILEAAPKILGHKVFVVVLAIQPKDLM